MYTKQNQSINQSINHLGTKRRGAQRYSSKYSNQSVVWVNIFHWQLSAPKDNFGGTFSSKKFMLQLKIHCDEETNEIKTISEPNDAGGGEEGVLLCGFLRWGLLLEFYSIFLIPRRKTRNARWFAGSARLSLSWCELITEHGLRDSICKSRFGLKNHFSTTLNINLSRNNNPCTKQTPQPVRLGLFKSRSWFLWTSRVNRATSETLTTPLSHILSHSLIKHAKTDQIQTLSLKKTISK